MNDSPSSDQVEPNRFSSGGVTSRFGLKTTPIFRNTLLWLVVSTAAVFMSMNWVSGSFTGNEYLPAGNDSFYHARRILDAAEDPAEFYEFDKKIHAPEGSWLVWPWGYDYVVARAVGLIQSVSGMEDPKPILAYIPVFWLYVNIALVLAIGSALGLSWFYRLVLGASVAVSPLTQLLHGVGLVDHHYVEYTFVLLSVLGGIRWFDDNSHNGKAAFLGYVLGIACGFHNALFMLQIPVLVAAGMLWLKGTRLSPEATARFAMFMLLGLVLVLLPSQPFRFGWFSYFYLSWFHLYVSSCTALLLLLISNLRSSSKSIVLLLGLSLLLVAPIANEVSSAGQFIYKKVDRLDVIVEAQSLWAFLTGAGGVAWVNSIYSLFIWLTPIWLSAAALYLLLRENPKWVYCSVWTLFGLGLMLLQFRMHYFGSLILYGAPIALVSILERRVRVMHKIALRSALTIVAVISFYFPFSNLVYGTLHPGIDLPYRMVSNLIPRLARECSQDPGVVLAFNDLGHYIRYHTECSVIANNFLLTPEHASKIQEIDEIFNFTPQEMLERRPDIKYLLLNAPVVQLILEDGSRTLLSLDQMRLANQKWPLIGELLFDETVPEGFEILQQQLVATPEETFAIARLIKITDLAGE